MDPKKRFRGGASRKRPERKAGDGADLPGRREFSRIGAVLMAS
jgi:hypothetical protein